MINKLDKIKALIFLFITQFSLTSFIKAASIDTKAMDAQDTAMMEAAGLSGNSNLSTMISVLIQIILGFLGIIFLALTILAGFKWMMSNGNEDDIKKAKGSLKNSIIGIVIILAAYAITYSVFKYLPFSSNGTGGGGASVTP